MGSGTQCPGGSLRKRQEEAPIKTQVQFQETEEAVRLDEKDSAEACPKF